MHGAYAIVVLSLDTPEEIVCAKNASPLVLGLGQGENFIASDVPALLPHTRRVVFLEEGDLAQVRSDAGVRIIDLEGNERTAAQRPPRTITWSLVAAEKPASSTSCSKRFTSSRAPSPIPCAVAWCISRPMRCSTALPWVAGDETIGDQSTARHFARLRHLVSRGARRKYMIERLARLPVEVDLASGFAIAIGAPARRSGDFGVAVGETADTLAAVKEARGRGAQTLSIANVVDSSIPRASHHALYTHAGPRSVSLRPRPLPPSSRRCFSWRCTRGDAPARWAKRQQLSLCTSSWPSPPRSARPSRPPPRCRRWPVATPMPGRALSRPRPAVSDCPRRRPQAQEISYIHAEGYAAGEMKHGPIALIDEGVPVIVLAPGSSATRRCCRTCRK